MDLQTFITTRKEYLLHIHLMAKGTHQLPQWFEDRINRDKNLNNAQREGVLSLFFYTAKNWDDWDWGGERHVGIGNLRKRYDEEYVQEIAESPEEWVYLTIPPLENGRDWRKNGYGKDSNPIDVRWTRKQIEILEDEYGGTDAAAT